MPFTPKIAIIGAGPAGLTLARLLEVSQVQVDVTIYERDASPTARVEQGGTLDLQAGTGLDAIRKCELWDTFSKHCRRDGEEMTLADKNATALVHLRGGEQERPEIDRETLKQILLDSVPTESVRWGRHLKHVMKSGMLRFDDGEEGPFDLIVGADGGNSKVRGMLSDIKPAYAGVSGFELEITDPPNTCPHVDQLVGRGSYLAASDRKILGGQRMGNNSLKARSWFQCPEGEAKKMLDSLGKEASLEKVLTWYSGWAPEQLEVLKSADVTSMRHWTLYELPVDSRWDHKKGYTLVGDAASLMTPFGGQGVNKAMKDALELAELIEKSQQPSSDTTLDQAVLRYEQQMFPRAAKVQAMTQNLKQTFFGPDGTIGVPSFMLKMMASDSPWFLIRMLGSWPVCALLFSCFWIVSQIGWAVRRYWRRT